MSKIYGNMVGGASLAQTIILQDSDGNEMPAVLVDSETVFDATANDIRAGKVAATESGVTVGEKEIPAYHTSEGYRIISNGDTVTIPNIDNVINDYDYTKLQALICLYNTSVSDSVSTEKVSINDSVYEVLSTAPIAAVTKNHDSKTIEFGITNNSGSDWLLRFFTYKEVI